MYSPDSNPLPKSCGSMTNCGDIVPSISVEDLLLGNFNTNKRADTSPSREGLNKLYPKVDISENLDIIRDKDAPARARVNLKIRKTRLPQKIVNVLKWTKIQAKF